jgi:hypothetical protein
LQSPATGSSRKELQVTVTPDFSLPLTPAP